VSGIAYRYRVSQSALVSANNITNPNRIYAGQRLVIPGCSTHPPGPARVPGGGYIYVVRRGDTLARIALRFRVRIWSIVQANNIPNPNLIHVGQRLYIPGTSPRPDPKPVDPGCEHLTWPRRGATLSGQVQAVGTADHENFGYYKLEFRKDGLDDWHYITGGETPVHDGPLGEPWNTHTVPDGNYTFRLVIVDATGNYPPPCEIAVRVANEKAVPTAQPCVDLRGKTWKLTSYWNGSAMKTVLAGTQITAIFGADGKVTGSAGCNTYYASYITSGDRGLSIGLPSGTRKTCAEPPTIMQQEIDYLSALQSASRYFVQGSELFIQNAAGYAVLGYVR
jgi:heat shock protein HslJ/LysM repeat protein